MLVYYQKALIIVLLPLKKVGTMFTYRFLTAFIMVINIIINAGVMFGKLTFITDFIMDYDRLGNESQ